MITIPSLAQLEIPEWTTRPLYSTEGGRSRQELSGVADAVFLPDSSLVIAYARNKLIALGASGQEIWRTGRSGEGPGEFYVLMGLYALGDSTLVAHDHALGRLTYFRSDGKLLRMQQIAPMSIPAVIGPSGEITVLRSKAGRHVNKGLEKDTVEMILIDSAGTERQKLGEWEKLSRYVGVGSGEGGWTFAVQIGFAPKLWYGSGGGRAALGNSRDMDIAVYVGSKLFARLRSTSKEGVSVRREDRQWWIQKWLADPELPPILKREYADPPMSEAYPVFGGIMVDAEGRTWIADYVSPTERDRNWTAFSREGDPIGRVRLPVFHDYRMSEGAELLAAIGDRVAIFRINDAGEVGIDVLRLEGAQSQSNKGLKAKR